MKRLRFLPILLALCAAALPAVAQETGLPLPRFVSLRADEVNMRTGPGVQYPVEWVYHRENLPMEILREYRTWRLVRDWQGAQGWIHQSMLSGRRTFMVLTAERTLRARPDAKAAAVAVLEPGVIGEIEACPDVGGWCHVRADGHAGWLRRVEFFGVQKSEAFD
jgi:SH3-like domain-containing protein